MKKIFLLLLLSSLVFGQESNVKSIVELKYDVLGMQNGQVNTSNLKSGILHPISSVKYQESEFLPQTSKKNPGIAILLSIFMPGMGELYANGYDSGKYFTIADGVLWGVFIGFNSYGNWKADNYKSFAQTNAGVDLTGKESDFYANVALYDDVYAYNTEQDFNRDYGMVYDTQKYYWKWASDAQRKEYKQMWSSSETAFNNVRFVAGALILNRLISAINAVRLVSAYNKNLNVETSWNMSVGVQNQLTLPTSITFNFIKAF